jgi:hypothetical protein
MEQSPEWRYALHVSPTAATVAAERICCMRYFACFQKRRTPTTSGQIVAQKKHRGQGIGPVAPFAAFDVATVTSKTGGNIVVFPVVAEISYCVN